MVDKNSGLQSRLSIVLFLCGLAIPNILLFLPRSDVDDAMQYRNLYSLNSVFKREHLVFKLRFGGHLINFFAVCKVYQRE